MKQRVINFVNSLKVNGRLCIPIYYRKTINKIFNRIIIGRSCQGRVQFDPFGRLKVTQ